MEKKKEDNKSAPEVQAAENWHLQKIADLGTVVARMETAHLRVQLAENKLEAAEAKEDHLRALKEKEEEEETRKKEEEEEEKRKKEKEERLQKKKEK